MKTTKLSEAVSVVLRKPLRRIISLSDVHLGHKNTPSGFIIENLNRMLPDTSAMDDVDVITIVGDLFDQTIGFHDFQAVLIKRWMTRFLMMCKRRDIMVLLLEGTPSHDWRQNRWMVEANALIGADLHYVDTLCVRYFEKFDAHVLFVPDEWQGGDTDATWKDAVQALADSGIEQVDFTMLHGSFDYQLPAVAVKAPRHLPERYLSITRKYIFAGHIHQSSMFERILANGSFDRLCHGEEDPKGMWDVRLSEHGDKIVFVENTEAMVYKTYDCRGYSIEDGLSKLETVQALPIDSHVRILANRHDPLLGGLVEIKRRYGHVNITVKIDKGADVQPILPKDLRQTFTQKHLSRENLPALLMARLRAKTTDPDVLAYAESLLEEAL